MGQKRPREVPAGITRRTEVYEDLAHVNQKIRLKAAHTLLTEFVPYADGGQLQDILRRLIRGLCSGRKAARIGFSVALTEFLSTLLGPRASSPTRFQDASGVIDTLIDRTQVAGGVDGQEDRDHHIGRLFGAEAIIKSGILFQAASDGGFHEGILDIVYDLAKKKPWLREQCGFVLYQSLEPPTTLAFVQTVIDKLQSVGLAKTPEGVAIWIAIQQKFPSVNVPNGVWHGNSPLHRKEKSKLALVLKEASVSELDDTKSDTKSTQRGSWSANVHFAWLVVITELLSQSEAKDRTDSSKCISFSEFWNNCVEDGLFKKTSSDERKYWGLVLFQRGLSMALTPDVVSSLFSAKLVQCLTNHLASSERYLHRAAEKARKLIAERAQTSLNMKIMILESLLMNGFVDFDKVSKTRTIEELLVGLDETSTTQVCEIYNAVILQPGIDDEKSAAQRRQIAADQLVTTVRNMQPGSSEAKPDESSKRSIQRILSLLAQFAYFDIGSIAQPEISTASHDLFKARLSSCLTYLAANIKDPSLFAYSLVQVISKRKSIPEDAKLLLEAEDAVQELLDRTTDTMRSMLARIDTSDQGVEGFYKCALLLMSLAFLQIYNGDLDAFGMLEELNETFSKKQLKQYEKQGLKSSAALIEILLSLVAKPSKLFRRLAQQVFNNLAPDVDKNGIQSMLKVLETKEKLEGQEALFDERAGDEEEREQEEDDEDDDGQDIDGDASDVEMSNVKMVQQEDQGSDAVDDTSSSSADGEENEEGPDDELTIFNAKLAQALGTRLGNEDLNAEDSDRSDEGMNDEEMEALDKHLENLFQEQKKLASRKTERKDAKKTIVDFKCRVLELLEIFIKKQHQNALALHLVLPLLTLLRTTSSPLVSQKAGDLVREYVRLCKGEKLPVVENAQVIFEKLQAVHQEALVQASNTHASGCSRASLLLVKVLASHNTEHLSRVIEIYGSTFSASQKKALAEKNFKVKMSLFTDFNNWVSSFKM